MDSVCQTDSASERNDVLQSRRQFGAQLDLNHEMSERCSLSTNIEALVRRSFSREAVLL